jgi:hypothetical protein
MHARADKVNSQKRSSRKANQRADKQPNLIIGLHAVGNKI